MEVKTLSGVSYFYNKWTNGIEMEDSRVFKHQEGMKFQSVGLFDDFPSLDTFVLELTRKCNLRCSYCCYSGEYRNNRVHGMSSMKEYQIDLILSFIQKNHRKLPVYIGFYGGESLLEYPMIQYCVSQARVIWNDDVKFFLSTNGVQLSPNRIDWFVENGFQLNISVDGGECYHDRYRKNIYGEGSFQSIHNNLDYIKDCYPGYYNDNVHLLMTLVDIRDLLSIAEEWNNDILLKDKAPVHISNLAPNYQKGVNKVNEEELRCKLYQFLEFYEVHPEYLVLKSFFDERIADWLNRSIYQLPTLNKMSTCMPYNRKVYIDVDGKIGVCEKMCDIYRIGDIYKGFDWNEANKMVQQIAERRTRKCVSCPIVRLCDICLTSIDLSDDEQIVFCHNQMTYTKLYLLMFCEMAERGLLNENE